ncbi:MAG: periplasmic heavy metal sensor [Alphaproteobacteria bacterium]|nr:periplasmic heavy metal sensor [Alphaproteobacteria bacterium]
MTTAEPNGRAPRRSRGLIVALALSLTLNVFFLGGAVWSHMRFHPFFERQAGPILRFEHIGREMNLNGAQQIALHQMVTTMRERRRAMFQANRPIFDSIWDQLAKPQPNDQTIAGLIVRADTNHVAFQKDATAAVESFLTTLSPQQRAQFAELAKWHPPPR